MAKPGSPPDGDHRLLVSLFYSVSLFIYIFNHRKCSMPLRIKQLFEHTFQIQCLQAIIVYRFALRLHGCGRLLPHHNS